MKITIQETGEVIELAPMRPAEDAEFQKMMETTRREIMKIVGLPADAINPPDSESGFHFRYRCTDWGNILRRRKMRGST